MSDDTPDLTTEQHIILLASTDHNFPILAKHLRNTRPNFREPTTLYSPLHKAILSLSPQALNSQSPTPEQLKAAEDTLRLLLENGAIWNDLDAEGLTPGCHAYKLGLRELYEIMVDAGVRAELLFSRLDGYSKMEDDEEEEDEEGGGGNGDGKVEWIKTEADTPEGITNGPSTNQPSNSLENQTTTANQSVTETEHTRTTSPEWKDATPITSTAYLSSRLTYHPDKLLDSSLNGVMMSWETDIMRRTVELLLPSSPISTDPSTITGPKVLNIGFGMGIIDRFFQQRQPSLHTIIEAHPDVLASPLLTSLKSNPNVEVIPGRWQDVIPDLISRNVVYDAIYFDTFAEDYSALREFFTEYVIGLLNPQGGRFGFFNGLGADRQISYDVYKKVVEMDLFEADLETQWECVKVPDLDEEKDGEENGVWEGVRRKYWCLKEYWLPICMFLS